MLGDTKNGEVARGTVTVSKLEGLERQLDHVISGERVMMKATVLWEQLARGPVSISKRVPL